MVRTVARALSALGSIVTVLGMAAAPVRAQGTNGTIDIASQVGLDQKLNAQVPLDTVFRDETGKNVPLRAYFGKRPVVLVMPFYKCPGICTLELEGMVKAFRDRDMNFKLGQDFDAVTVSINPKETPDLAAAKKKEYIELYTHPKATDPKVEASWHFLTGDVDSIHKLAQAVGFRYFYDPVKDQYAHPAGLIVLTPEGKVSRYLYGAEYRPFDLRLSLVEASANKIGSPVEQLLLLCYHYDPVRGKYGLVIMNVIKLAGFTTVALLGGSILLLVRWEKRHANKPPSATDRPLPPTDA